MNITGSSKERRLTKTQRKILIGAHPFIACWVVFGLGNLFDFGLIVNFAWWSLPYLATSLFWIVFAVVKANREFEIFD
jgi:hypothetical protein